MLAVPSLTTKAMVLGINSDPLTDNAQTGIDYAFSIGAAATFTALESNTAQGAATAYTSGPVFALAYDEGVLRYAYNATVYRTVADIGANREFWLDTSFDTAAGAACSGPSSRRRRTWRAPFRNCRASSIRIAKSL